MDYSNDQVRRQDRLLEETEARRLLGEGEYGFLAMQAGEGGYGIPVSYVWDGDEHIYIHCAPQGRKLRCIDTCPKVSFCVVGHTQVIPERFTTAYESVVAEGIAHRNLTADERMHALGLLIDKYSPNEKEIGLKYAEKSFHRTEIIRIDIVSCSGKCKIG